jgi:hypothetical protein
MFKKYDDGTENYSTTGVSKMFQWQHFGLNA